MVSPKAPRREFRGFPNIFYVQAYRLTVTAPMRAVPEVFSR